MNVELTIQEMFDNYPDLFKDRADCLNHLFCTIGNGYEWVNGELVEGEVETDYIKELESHLVGGKAFQHNKLSLQAESQLYENQRIKDGWYEKHFSDKPKEFIEKLKKARKEHISKLPEDVYHKESERYKRWYFYINIPGHEHIDFCEAYALLFNYPGNIKPDWLAAIEECRSMLVEDGYQLPPKRNT